MGHFLLNFILSQFYLDNYFFILDKTSDRYQNLHLDQIKDKKKKK